MEERDYFCIPRICDCCKEAFWYVDEVVFLNGDNIVENEEHGGSGDINRILCNECYKKEYE